MPTRRRDNKPVHTPKLRLVPRLYKTFVPYLKPYWFRLGLAAASVVGSVLMTLLEPWPLKLIFDHVLLGKPVPSKLARWNFLLNGDKHEMTMLFCAAFVLIVACNAAFSYANRYLLAAVGQSVTNDIRLAVFDHVQRLSLSSIGATRTGDIVFRLTSDIKSLRDLLVGHLQKLGTQALSFASTVGVMFWMDWLLALVSLSVAPLLYVTSRRFSVNVRAAIKKRQAKESEVASAVQETMSAIAMVQAFTQETREKKRFRQQSADSLEAALESMRWGRALSQLIRVLSAIGLALAAGFGALRVLAGRLTPGGLIVFTAYVKDLYNPIEKLSELVVEFAESLVSGERILELMETDSAVKNLPDAAPAPPFEGRITFENVVFGYHPASPVTNDLSFTAEPGRMIALVGSSGAGKSTIVNLVLRFFDPWAGRVLVDGTDIRRFELKSLRGQISVVPQDPVLFRRTVRENVAYGSPGATLEEVVAVAKAAAAHDFILKLPSGYETVLEERGCNLSGGQRQRLALARAMLRDAPILILDEPGASLDAFTEAQVEQALRRLMRGKTTFVIAHRLSTIRTADLILVLEEGRPVEQGTHQELLAKSALYRELYEMQGRHGASMPECVRDACESAQT